MNTLTNLWLAATADGRGVDVFGQVFESKGMVLAVLIVLVCLSVACWFIIGAKTVSIARATKQSRSFIHAFRSATRLAELYQYSQQMPQSPARDMFRAGYEELDLILREREGKARRPRGDGPAAMPESSSAAFENIERSLVQAQTNASAKLERFLSFLATVGSAAPFIGLFGTVWGIMNAFNDIDVSQPILETVTPHIAEALVATAIGLLAAIPAVMAYNWQVGRLKHLEVHLQDFSADYLNILRRHFFS
ncbi:MAG: MotA/TolQ/ExbB proton channel family protein [Deltaproteobacteria bacterium]|nr:MotA/TolQ/ExbB proton channel family protein [Deltaproteobacteria bacterium]